MDYESNLCLKAVLGIEKNTEIVINMEAQNLKLSNNHWTTAGPNQQTSEQTNPLPNQKRNTDKGQENEIAPIKATLPVLLFWDKLILR